MKKADGLNLSLYVQPWMLDAPYFQSIVSTLDVTTNQGFNLGLDTANDLALWIGNGTSVESFRLSFSARLQRWVHVDLTIEGPNIRLRVNHLVYGGLEKAPAPSELQTSMNTQAALDSPLPLLFAATRAANTSTPACRPTHFFNGRLDAPCFTALGEPPWTIARYDFSKNISTDEIFDVSGSGLDGKLINQPTRAVRGHDYDHHSIGTNWNTANYGFGAIHFHDDDLDDANWETDFTITIPSTVRSGAYAVEIWDPETALRDYAVFFVRPKEIRPQAKTAFVFSTFTFLAYANEHMYDETKSTHISFPEGVQPLWSENYARMLRRTDLGMSIYDLHSDGSGVVYSSSKRPILNMRPDYVHWAFGRPREFSADLLMVGLLEKHLGDAYDILTDHDLHMRGVSALAGYDCVVTGSHPEYPSAESLDAYEGFAKRGGYLIYTGGNGFYVCIPSQAVVPIFPVNLHFVNSGGL